jgi:hypothetical protein
MKYTLLIMSLFLSHALFFGAGFMYCDLPNSTREKFMNLEVTELADFHYRLYGETWDDYVKELSALVPKHGDESTLKEWYLSRCEDFLPFSKEESVEK